MPRPPPGAVIDRLPIRDRIALRLEEVVGKLRETALRRVASPVFQRVGDPSMEASPAAGR